MNFHPTLVPKSTLKSLAKRLKAHPTFTTTSTSQRQDIMAKTFGHLNWHSLCQSVPAKAPAAASLPRERARLYQWLGEFSEAKVSLDQSLGAIANAAQQGGLIDLKNLSQLLLDQVNQGASLSDTLETIIAPFAPLEAFLIGSAEKGGNLTPAFREARKIALNDLLHCQKGETV